MNTTTLDISTNSTATNHDFIKYKQDYIQFLKNIYNKKIECLKNNLNKQLTVINLLRTNKNKENIINNLNTQYSKNTDLLNQALNKKIAEVNSWTIQELNLQNSKNTSALLIGIDYFGTDHQLNGCINDVNAMSIFLQNNGFNNNNIKILTDNTNIKPTKDNILNNFINLLKNAKSGDIIFFFYSGHGSNTVDNNSDKHTKTDDFIVPID